MSISPGFHSLPLETKKESGDREATRTNQMEVSVYQRVPDAKRERGFTLLELIIATAILVILSTMALPIARLTIQREKERMLRKDLWEMRDAIDRYKDMADRGGFQTKVDSNGYPPDLETLLKGVDVQGKKNRFLRRIPIDPMTGTTEWGMHSMQDDPDSDSWGGQNVFDVYTKSQGTALDGTKYKDW
jgi:general secretion pathway protein G